MKKNPRIYTYKITFEEVPYYYYGVHKEDRYGEYYMGTPITHKWCWHVYTPKKQILEFFEYSDSGYLRAQEVEKRLIKPFYQTDKWCLNENCGGCVSLEASRMGGYKSKELGLGVWAMTQEERIEAGKKGGHKTKELGVGVHGMTQEERIEAGKKGGNRVKELGEGIHKQTPEERKEFARQGGHKTKELGVGLYAMTQEERIKAAKKGAAISAKIIAEKYSKDFAFISPTGKIVKGRNIRNFCRTHKLDSSCILKVLKGVRSHHLGWRRYIPNQITVVEFCI